MIHSDSTPEAVAVQTEILRKQGGAARLQSAFEMSLAVRGLAMARLRIKYPGHLPSELLKDYIREVVAPGLAVRFPQ